MHKTDEVRTMIKKSVWTWFALVLMATAVYSQTALKYKGVYTAWGQSQHSFTLGKADYNDDYVVQMLRLRLSFAANPHVRAITRFDLGQGWWGVDNADRTVDRIGKTGGSSLFDFKDTNFLFHVDQAYMEFDIPDTPLMFRVGRMWYGFGNKMVLDNNLDGIQLVINKKVELGWAKVSEGVDGLTDNEVKNTAGSVVTDGNDADLLYASLKNKAGDWNYQLFGFYYNDAGDDDGTTYMPNDINYFRSRFTPNISKLACFGLSAHYQKKGFNFIGELDVLVGKDDVNNTTINAKQLTDINNGDINGYNLYLKLNKKVSPKFNLGGVFGLGSGDDDWTGGKGNVNKLRTSGFFYVTEIWEDSIMPDEEGITPQGLGAPNVRGYRELENTTLFQINGKVNLTPKVSLFGSFTYLGATQAIHGWHLDALTNTTVIDPASSKSIGQEVDWKLDWKVYPQLVLTFRGGVFFPGDAAGYLINGTNQFNDAAWETKTTVTYKF
ncbi:MAG: hypothetical protein D6814_05960 [Calditrichaeota bacterium]|nr:MAG: hypothetical protein D6814_05960 [Calditrichota bacterium]